LEKVPVDFSPTCEAEDFEPAYACEILLYFDTQLDSNGSGAGEFNAGSKTASDALGAVSWQKKDKNHELLIFYE
jgi:hypothetical protein